MIPLIERLRYALSRCNFTWELVLVGNYIEGSDDETPQVVRELAERWPDVSAAQLSAPAQAAVAAPGTPAKSLGVGQLAAAARAHGTLGRLGPLGRGRRVGLRFDGRRRCGL